MSGSVYGTIFKISTWGESHGAGVGVVVDGCPAGLPLNEEDIQKYLDRRDRENFPQPEAKEIRQRSYPVFLREKQQEHQSLL
mgnify:CR=1 FL=1